MKVAAYCRVSTDRDDQANSLENQQLFFHEFIIRNPEWSLVKIYSDEGVSGTSVSKRDGFNEMIAAAKNKEIDLIVTKEVSRFARNTVDTLSYTRELRRYNVGVYFINDNINTLDNDGEFRLAIMASVAQEESRKISSRVKWGMQRQMERGYAFTPPIIGYDFDDGDLIINEEEAKIVRRIYHMYVNEGMGSVLIAKTLAAEGVPLCKRIKCWSPTLIMRIIKNEKYVGDLLLKKTITTDYLTHKVEWNDGIEDKIFFENHHEPIVSREIWDKAQKICESRFCKESAPPASAHNNRYWCSGKVYCGDCGGSFVSKIKNAEYGITRYYRCKRTTHYQNGKGGCPNKTYIDERMLVACVKYVLTKLSVDSEDILDTLKKAVSKLDVDYAGKFSVEDEIDKIEQKRKKLLNLLLDETITKQDYQNMIEGLNSDLQEVYKKREKYKAEIDRRNNLESQMKSVVEKAREYLEQEEPTPYLYAKLVEKIVVHNANHVDVYIYDIEKPFSIKCSKTGRGSKYIANCCDY